MMDELKQQFYEVMHKYQKPFSEEGVAANLTQWGKKQGKSRIHGTGMRADIA